MRRIPGAVVWCALVVALLFGVTGCGVEEGAPETLSSTAQAVTGGGLSNAGLKLETQLAACASTLAQDYFNVVNTGTTSVTLSDVKIKLWVDDTSAANIVAAVNYGGCLNNATGCYKPVTGVTATATKFSPACGPDANHQANWEVTLATTDTTPLKAGEAWKNIQSSLRLANYANFSPGSSKWYSACGAGQGYQVRPHFAVYYQNRPVFSSDTGVTPPACRAPHGSQQLTGHVRPEIATAPLVGPVAGSTTVHVSVGLPLRNQTQLADLVSRVSDPSSADYRHYITPADLTATYAPTTASFQSLQTWAQAQNLTLGGTYSHRLVLDVTGTAAAVQQALYVSLNYYKRADGTQFYAADREPSLDLSTTVLHVTGLDSFQRPKPAGAGWGAGSIQGTDLRAAYVSNAADSSCPAPSSLLGDGQCVAIIGNNPADPADISAFAAMNGLGDYNVATQLENVSVDGFGTSLPGIGSILEAEVDVEMVLAMAPHAKEVLYLGRDGPSYGSSLAAIASPTQHALCNQVNLSWLLYSDPINAQLLHYVLPAQGQTVLYATGDDGATRYTPPAGSGPFPDNVAYDYMTWVGGTSLTSTGGGTYSETPWSFGVGGYNNVIPQPAYQASLPLSSLGGSTTGLNLPDVSAQADTTVTVVATTALQPPAGQCPSGSASGQVIHVGGTSLSAPTWAGFIALANQLNQSQGLGPVGFVTPALYSIGTSSAYAQSFHDIQTGANIDYGFGPVECGSSTLVEEGPGFNAVAGFDLATGWGSPKCGLLNRLASYSPAPMGAVAGGGAFNCALRADSTMACWGANGYGQSGTGAYSDTTTPHTVAAPLTQVYSVSAGENHVCALLGSGPSHAAKCWGSNGNGQLGNTTFTGSSSPTPIDVTVLTGLTSISAGSRHTCAVQSGSVWCWGANDRGQLGNGTTNNSVVAQPVGGLGNVTAVAAGADSTCAIQSDGSLWCWGANESGQLGIGKIGDSLVPQPVALPGLATAVAVGVTHGCALMSVGNVACWGLNGFMELGTDDTLPSDQPRTVLDPVMPIPWSGASALSVGKNHTCAVKNGQAYCWGRGDMGQIGNGTFDFSLGLPTPVTAMPNAASVVSGTNGNCAITTSGFISCWGDNSSKQLGDGSNDPNRPTPGPVHFF